MRKVTKRNLSPEISLISAIIVHASIEIPFFIFPVIVISVGEDIFQNMEGFRWVGLGAIGTVGTLAAGLPSPIFGSLADRYRRGSMMFFSLILSSFGALIVGLFSGSFFAMLIGILLMGLGVSLYHPPGLSWVSTAFEDPKTRVYSSKYNRILALHGIGGTIGASLGPLSVYFLIDIIDWHQIYLLWFLPIFLIALAFWVLIGRHEPAVETLIPPSRTYGIDSVNKLVTNQKQNNYSIMWIIFAFFIAMSLTRGMISFILSPFLIEEKKFETAEAAFFVGFSTLLGVVGQLTGGYFADKYGEKLVLSFCAACEVIILA
ncbi:MAG: MFS transporter, partial [Promethearchaeota archaeon]